MEKVILHDDDKVEFTAIGEVRHYDHMLVFYEQPLTKLFKMQHSVITEGVLPLQVDTVTEMEEEEVKNPWYKRLRGKPKYRTERRSVVTERIFKNYFCVTVQETRDGFTDHQTYIIEERED